MIQNFRRNPSWNPESMTIPEIWNLRNKLIENPTNKRLLNWGKESLVPTCDTSNHSKKQVQYIYDDRSYIDECIKYNKQTHNDQENLWESGELAGLQASSIGSVACTAGLPDIKVSHGGLVVNNQQPRCCVM